MTHEVWQPPTDPMTQLETDALVLIVTSIGYEPKSARGFIAGYLWRSAEHNANVPTAQELADAYHEWFYNLSAGTMKWYREQERI